MFSFEMRVRHLENRASVGARLLLQLNSGHPNYPELIDTLESIPGRIFQEDVINTLTDIVMQKNSRPPHEDVG